jgi:hypothetical protein
MAGFATICFTLFLSDAFAAPDLPLAGDSISRRSNISDCLQAQLTLSQCGDENLVL